MHFHTRGLHLFIGALLVSSWAAAAQPDGPYVSRTASGWQAMSVEVAGDVASKQVKALETGAAVTVAAVGSAPSFAVKLREPAANAPDEIRTDKGAPLFVVADTHGEYEILVGMLRAHKVVDGNLRWKFARGHLVVLGDVFDRGPNHLEILWLLYELEAQAAKAGGGVHLVLGNHETMVMRGDLRYLNARYVESARVLEQSSYSSLVAANTVLGQWLRSKPVMLKVDDLLCLHAGVSRALVDSRLSLADINATARSALNDEPGQGAMSELVMGTFGPLWYRGYFAAQSNFPTATEADVELTLKTFGVKRILVGHTIVPTITPLYAGKVIAVQVYPKRDDGQTTFESLLIRKGELFQAGVDGGLRKLEFKRGTPNARL